MSKTMTQMILCTRCGAVGKETDDTCTRCGYERYAAHRCDFCGETVTRRVYDTLRICIPCAKAERDGMAYKFAKLDANIKQLEEL